MSPSIVPQLVRKDFMIMGRTILIFCLISVVSMVLLTQLFGRIPNWVLLNFGFTFLVGPVGTLGIVLLMKTNVFEKEKATQSFIMSLPVTVKEFTRAKLWVNLPVFAVLWLMVSSIAFYFIFSHGLFPPGAMPFITMVFVGVFVAYTGILSTSLLSQSLGITILSILFFEMGTSAYLWAVAFLPSIGSHAYGATPVWNTTALAIVACQVVFALAAILITTIVQNGKRDFV